MSWRFASNVLIGKEAKGVIEDISWVAYEG
jgi:hypothetical protein